MEPVNQILEQAKYLVAIAFMVGLSLVGLMGVGYLLIHWFKHKDREKRSLDFVLLQVAVP